jgi:hypothetical protein
LFGYNPLLGLAFFTYLGLGMLWAGFFFFEDEVSLV